MKTVSINEKVKDVSVIGIGCMRINGLQDEKAVRDLAETAMDSGINFLITRTFTAGVSAKRSSAGRFRPPCGRR